MEATDDGVSRGAEDVKGAHEESRRSADFELLAAGESDGLLADFWGRDGSGRSDEDIAMLPQ